MANKEADVKKLEREVARLTSLLNSFWTGDVPDCATLEHMALAKAGRQRLAERAKKPALLAN